MEREEAEKNVDGSWSESTTEDKFYGHYYYPKYPPQFIEKMKGLVTDGHITQEELDSIITDLTRMAGGVAPLEPMGIDEARAKVREDCIKYEMKRA